jgi:ankyrin repeat protein
MVQKLIHLGADVNVLDNDMRTPLHHAAEEGKDRVIPLLVKAGASTGTKDTLTKKTPFQLAKNDRTREIMIVYSAPPFLPSGKDLDDGFNVQGSKMHIERIDN